MPLPVWKMRFIIKVIAFFCGILNSEKIVFVCFYRIEDIFVHEKTGYKICIFVLYYTPFFPLLIRLPVFSYDENLGLFSIGTNGKYGGTKTDDNKK